MVMSKPKALKDGFCGECAAFSNGRWNCGVIGHNHADCQLTDEIIERWCSDPDKKIKRNGHKIKFGSEVYHGRRKKPRNTDLI